MAAGSDKAFGLLCDPYLPLWRFRREQRIADALIWPCHGAQPTLAMAAVSHGATLTQERLRPATVGADRLQGTAMIRTVPYDFQCPEQRHAYDLAAVAPGSEASRTPGSYATSQQLRRQHRFPGEHCETRQVRSSSQFSDHRCEPGCNVADVVDGGRETARLGCHSAGEHIPLPRVAREEFVVGQSSGGHTMGLCEPGKVACQAFYRSCAETGWAEVVEAAMRGHRRIVQAPGFVLDHFTRGHVRLHD